MTDTTASELEALFAKQRKAFLGDIYPSLQQRLERLKTLEQLMIDCREEAREALAADFGSHPPRIVDLFENGGIIGRSRHLQAHLAAWMTPDQRPLDPLVHGGSSVEVIRQPKGVMGAIAPWNFPIESALVMVCDMLAAGNRVIVKTSELAPATAALLRRVVPERFPEDVLSVVNGGVELAQQFASLPWDHLTYTGSTRVGRLVAMAAAPNLTPVTLELGGKNPTIFARDGIDDRMILEFLSFKFCKSGQICTSPDYVFVPADDMERWVEIASRVWRETYPSYIGHPDVTAMINETHYDRVLDMIEEARDHGATVINLSDEAPDRRQRHIAMHLVLDPSDDLLLMREEIFGPVLAVKPYQHLDEIWDYVNTRPRPLASYLATRDDALVDTFRTAVISGGAAVNVYGFQGAEPSVPFGGVGASGHGCHSGYEGFLNYSHSKSLYRCADDNPVKASIVAPYGELLDQVTDAIFGSPG